MAQKDFDTQETNICRLFLLLQINSTHTYAALRQAQRYILNLVPRLQGGLGVGRERNWRRHWFHEI